MGSEGNDEVLLALDRKTGDRRWATRTGRNRGDGMGGGPRGTPTVVDGKVYALGANGDLLCADAANGTPVWQVNILERFGGNNIGWGISESVLIDGDKVICTPGGRQATMAALDKATGKTIWSARIEGTPQAAYSSPVAVEVGGLRQYVNFVHTGVVSVRADDGNPLWGQAASANGTANCSTPIVIDNLIFTSSGYGTGGALFRVNPAGRSEVAYSTKEMQNHHGGMVAIDGFLYGFDEQILKCLDLRSGKVAWQSRSVGKGSLTAADGMLYLRGENGSVALAAVSPQGYVEKGRFDQPDRADKPAWAHPVVAGGQLFLRDWDKLLVYDVAAR
jgi:outer membrane protein assembly factor BamB